MKTPPLKIALVTYAGMANYQDNESKEDNGVAEALTTAGFIAEAPVWNDPQIDWSAYRKIIIKSTWDYYELPTAWFEWLSLLERYQLQTLNPLKTIRWNSDKIYLQDIQEQGFNIVPSLWLDTPATLDATLFDKLQAEKIVIKPRISAGAKDTFVVTKSNLAEKAMAMHDILQQGSFIAQPFLQQITDEGEYSFIYIAGELSHVVLKTPQAGDFRVQHLFGGTVTRVRVPESYRAQADQIVAHFGQDCLHARVDMVDIGQGQLALMELELIEPYLFLNLSTTGLEKYAAAIARHT